ncbi:unnamed protein product [Thelazia callipaeda]|uniref:Aggrecan core protein n=1 Tax=Thelazia callipaeda TaxID=103827 RepID=A0A0N5CKI6_THECL|nr:unnamed protein product [Thelazia callipaeda]
MHGGWFGFGSGHNGRKYEEKGWHDSWHSGTAGNDRKVDNWGGKNLHKWSWGNGGAQGWGSWGKNMGRQTAGYIRDGYGNAEGNRNRNQYEFSNFYGSNDCCHEMIFGGSRPDQGYTEWGNVNSDTWKNTAGGEGWSKWTDDQEQGRGGRGQGGWKGWKSGSGSGTWDTWKNTNKPLISAKAQAFASSSIDP